MFEAQDRKMYSATPTAGNRTPDPKISSLCPKITNSACYSLSYRAKDTSLGLLAEYKIVKIVTIEINYFYVTKILEKLRTSLILKSYFIQ